MSGYLWVFLMKLYVKSENTGGIERSPGFFFHSCDLRTKQDMTFYCDEDFEAIDFLRKSGFDFELVDLSKCSFVMRLKAQMVGVNKTPTLVLDDGTVLKGLRKIEEFVHSLSRANQLQQE